MIKNYNGQVMYVQLNPLYPNTLSVFFAKKLYNTDKNAIFELTKNTKIYVDDKESTMIELLNYLLNNKVYTTTICEIVYEEDNFDFVVTDAKFTRN